MPSGLHGLSVRPQQEVQVLAVGVHASAVHDCCLGVSHAVEIVGS